MTAPAALITGSSRGIGRAIALRMAREGYSVVVNYARSEQAAAEVVEQIDKAGGTAIAAQGDVGVREDRQRLVASAVEEFGRLDLLVNNAGITSQGRKDLLEATEESWDRVFDTNLKGAFFLSQLAAAAMIESIASGDSAGGAIVNISSISAYAVSTNRADYCIAKAGMEMMTKLFAQRLAEQNIRVFEIRPGVVKSDMTAPVEEKYDRLIAEGLTPIRRWGQPEDVAAAVAAVAGDDFPFSTGDTLNVDGGFHIRSL